MNRPKRILVFLVDGFDPALRAADASTLDGRGVLPSLTNVNHISLPGLSQGRRPGRSSCGEAS